MSGFVVVQRDLPDEPGVVGIPGLPGAESVLRAIAQDAKRMSGGRPPAPIVQYLCGTDPRILSFSADRQKAQVFPTKQAAQTVIDSIPANMRPSGLTVESA